MEMGESSSPTSFSLNFHDDEEKINNQNSYDYNKERVEHDQEMTGQLHVAEDEGSNKFDDMIFEGKVFESEKDAYEQYLLYALKVGFCVRKDKQYLRADGSVRSRYFVCFKEGERRKDRRYPYAHKESKERKPRLETRTGCKARMAVKNVQNEWICSEIIRQHNHPLSAAANAADIAMEDKDLRIRELSEELQQERRLRTACQERLNLILKDVEEHTNNLSSKVDFVVNNVKKFESEEIDISDDKVAQ